MQLFTDAIPLGLLLATFAVCYGEPEEGSPVCTSRFDHDIRVLQTLAEYGMRIKQLEEEISQIKMTDTGGKCLDGWMPWNGKCYFFLTEQRTYSNAKAYCNRQGGKLAEPQSVSDNEFLKKMVRQFKTENWWIGLSDEETEGSWVWNTSGSAPSYDDWKQGNPNQGRKCNCGAYWWRYDYGWVDEPCGYSYNAICEI